MRTRESLAACSPAAFLAIALAPLVTACGPTRNASPDVSRDGSPPPALQPREGSLPAMDRSAPSDPPRRSLLGFSIASAGTEFRLVEDEPDERVISTGTLEDCEKELLRSLRERHGEGHLNAVFPTLGGKQFWSDRVLLARWRIQEHVYTGHCRLLDPDDQRRAWGSFEACRVVLEDARQARKLGPRGPELVIVLHGLIRSKDSLAEMTDALDSAGYEVADVNYPSTRRSIAEHSAQLDEIIANYEGVRRVSFVTHSLGGIVVRELLSRRRSWQERIEPGRVVMIAPPNQGSVLAETARDWWPYRWIMGDAGQELDRASVAELPPPACEFAIIAGGNGENGYNPLLEGDDDGVVTVERTRLDGASGFLLIPALHTFLMNHPRTIDATLRFLSEGRLSPSGTSAG